MQKATRIAVVTIGLAIQAGCWFSSTDAFTEEAKKARACQDGDRCEHFSPPPCMCGFPINSRDLERINELAADTECPPFSGMPSCARFRNPTCIDGQCQENPCKGDSDCRSNHSCIHGDCVQCPACAEGERCIAARCLPIQCGSVACAEGTACQAGACVDIACLDLACPANHVCRAGSCIDPRCDNVACPPEQTCNAGICVPARNYQVR